MVAEKTLEKDNPFTVTRQRGVGKIAQNQCQVVLDGKSIYIGKPTRRPVDAGELANQIADKAAFAIRYKELQQIASSDRQGVFRITEKARKPSDVPFEITINPDRSEAKIALRRGSEVAREVTFLDILFAVRRAGISKGILHEVLDQIADDPSLLKKDPLVIAKQIPPTRGRNASFQIHFDPQESRAPLVREDGTVDYHQINVVKPVSKGQVLVTKTPALPGRDGFRVTGEVIPAESGEDKSIPKGVFTSISSDGLQLLADCRGHVFIKDGKINVENIFVVPGHVDYSTGDIRFGGDVVVQGNILSNFKVETTGIINVRKFVEAAQVKSSEAAIQVEGGVHGGGKAVLQAAGNIEVGFAERATLKSGKSVLSKDSLVNCEIEAGCSVVAKEKKGIINGGRIQVGQEVICKVLGGNGTVTEVEIGGGLDPKTLKRVSIIRERCTPVKEEIGRLQKTLKTLEEQGADGSKIQQAIGKLEQELKDIREEAMGHYDLHKDASVTVLQRMCSGTVIRMAGMEFRVTQNTGPCRIKIVDGEIRVLPLGG